MSFVSSLRLEISTCALKSPKYNFHIISGDGVKDGHKRCQISGSSDFQFIREMVLFASKGLRGNSKPFITNPKILTHGYLDGSSRYKKFFPFAVQFAQEKIKKTLFVLPVYLMSAVTS